MQPQCNRKFCQFNNDQYCTPTAFLLWNPINHLGSKASLTRLFLISRNSPQAAQNVSSYHENTGVCHNTVLVLIKLKKIAVALRLRCGSCNLIFFTLFHHFLLNFRTLYIVWGLVSRRVTRHHTGSNLSAAFLNVAKYFKTLRFGCMAVAFTFSIYFKPVL